MWQTIKDLIAKLFGKKTNKTDNEALEHHRDTAEYEDTHGPNLTAIIASKLATYAVSESGISVTGDNKRAECLDGLMSAAWSDAQEITARSFGVGGVALVPYVANGKVYTDIVQKDRFHITHSQGKDILAATVIADVIIRNDKRYTRFIDYSLEGSTYFIRSKATCEDTPVELSVLPEWQGIQEEISISGVDRLLLAYLKQPYSKGRTDNLYGVPVTRGSEWIIDEIKECLLQIRKEYAKKDARVFVDETLFGKDDEIDADVFKKVLGGGKMDAAAFFEIFDPAFRDTSYYNRLTNLFALLEKSIGTSKGVLTDPQTVGATATEIKRSSYDTYALITAMRKQWEDAAEDLVYAYNVLCNAFNLAPMGDYEVKFNWSQDLIESSTETWAQMKDGQSIGVVKKSELRRQLYPNETDAEAQAAIDGIAATEPSLTSMMGMDEEGGTAAVDTGAVKDAIDETVSKTLNGAQTQSLISIMTQFKGGVLSENQAINLISVSIGITKDEAKDLLAEA